MSTQNSPIALIEEEWTEISPGCCTVQAQAGHVWIRIADEQPVYDPQIIDGREYDGHLIGLRAVPHQALRYSAVPSKKVFARARTSDGAIVMVTDV